MSERERIARGDVLLCRKSFSNPDLLRKGDVVIARDVGDDGCVSVVNLMRGSGDYGYSPNRFKRVGRNVAWLVNLGLTTTPAQPERGGDEAKRSAPNKAPDAAEVVRLREGLEEIVCWFGEAPHTFPDWKTTAEALADMAQNVLDGHPALSTPESRAMISEQEGRA